MGNDHIEAARIYHEVTKHSYTSVRTAPHYLDWDNRPLTYKIYPEAGALALPRNLSLSRAPTLSAICSEAAGNPDAPLDIQALTRILFCADGLTRSRVIDGDEYHFRAAPSAGALYPIEIYLAAADLDGLETGLYHFSPGDLKLRGLRRGDWRELIARTAAMRPALVHARGILLFSAMFWRSAWKYRARAYRYCFWDTGTILANLLATAAAEGVAAEVVTAFADPELEALIGIDGKTEGLTCLVAVGETPKPLTNSPELTPFPFEAIRISRTQVEYEDLAKMHRESRLLTANEAAQVASAKVALPARPESKIAPLNFGLMPPQQSLGLGETILRRGSTRVFAWRAVPASELATILSASTRHPRGDFPELTETYLIVNAVEGLEPGAYYHDRKAEGFELIRRGEFRREAGYLCLEQPLGSDCAALIVYMADLEGVLRGLGNRGYRDAHLEAGLLAGRAYLAAYSLGRGATGLTFYDDETTKFFEPHAAGKSPLLMVAIGVPRSRASATS